MTGVSSSFTGSTSPFVRPLTRPGPARPAPLQHGQHWQPFCLLVTAPVMNQMRDANPIEATEEILWSDDLVRDIPVPKVIPMQEVKWTDCMDAMRTCLNERHVTSEFVSVWIYMLMESADPFSSGSNTRFDRVSEGLSRVSDGDASSFIYNFRQPKKEMTRAKVDAFNVNARWDCFSTGLPGTWLNWEINVWPNIISMSPVFKS